MIKCELCEENKAQIIFDNMNVCNSCYDGLVFELMKVKPIKKDNNEPISNNLSTSIGKVFGNNSDK